MSPRPFAKSLRLLSLLLLLAPSLAAQPEPEALFPLRAEITAPAGVLSRVLLPPEVLRSCRGDLSDVRIFDEQGREVPFLVDRGLAGERAWELLTTVSPPIVSAEREEEAREGAPNLLRERYGLALPSEMPEASEAAWELVIESPRSAFVRRVVVTDGNDLRLEGSFFRLSPSAGAAADSRERLRLPLPGLPVSAASSEPAVLEVLLEGEEGFYLEPTFRLEAVRRLAGTEWAAVPLEELERREVGETTHLELARPRGVVPDQLRLATATPAFRRRVEVWDEGPGALDAALSREALFRVPALVPVEDLEVPLAAPRGDRLRLVIANGDSPPLEDLEVAAVVRRPALLFTLSTPRATLLFGGGRAHAPNYDLEGLLPTGRRQEGEAAEVGSRLVDPQQWAEAQLGEAEPNPRFDPTPILAFAHQPGRHLDSRPFRHRRELEVGAGSESLSEGLARWTFTLEDLAVARQDLADVRIVDEDDRQWPYLVERGEAEVEQPLAVGEPEVRDGVSRYRLEFSEADDTGALAPDRLALETEAPFFDRDYELVGFVDGDEIPLARGRWMRRAGDPRPLTVACPARPVEALELRIQDGDDAPLAFTRIEAHVPVPTLYFPAPAGRYNLLLGYPEADPPRYELERIRDLVLTVLSTEAQAATLEDNPAFRLRARLAGDEGKQQLLLWLVLALAVVVLGRLTLRLVR
jgi:hypothetical protein